MNCNYESAKNGRKETDPALPTLFPTALVVFWRGRRNPIQGAYLAKLLIFLGLGFIFAAECNRFVMFGVGAMVFSSTNGLEDPK